MVGWSLSHEGQSRHTSCHLSLGWKIIDVVVSSLAVFWLLHSIACRKISTFRKCGTYTLIREKNHNTHFPKGLLSPAWLFNSVFRKIPPPNLHQPSQGESWPYGKLRWIQRLWLPTMWYGGSDLESGMMFFFPILNEELFRTPKILKITGWSLEDVLFFFFWGGGGAAWNSGNCNYLHHIFLSLWMQSWGKYE